MFERINQLPGVSIVFLTYLVGLILPLILSLLVGESNLQQVLLAVLIISVSYGLVLFGMMSAFFLIKPAFTLKHNTSRQIFLTAFVSFVIIITAFLFLDFHVAGTVSTGGSIPFLEGVFEITSRYVVPSMIVIFFIFHGKSRIHKFFIYAMIVSVIICSLYLDLILKSSKQVFLAITITFILVNYEQKRFSKRAVFISFLIIISVFAYITFTRILSYTELQKIYGNDFQLEAMYFLLQVIYDRTVILPELLNLLSEQPDKLQWSIPFNFAPDGLSLANVYTNEVHGFPFGSGHSSAPGFVTFFLFNFGLPGIILIPIFGICIGLIYIAMYFLSNASILMRIPCDLLVAQLLLDATLDERLFAVFIFKFFIVILTIQYISRFSQVRL